MKEIKDYSLLPHNTFGMVDPNVLEANGIDSKVYSGYALGMGIERITNLKYRVNDLRLFSENDTRFLKEFEAAN
jgi:phenylalanyl-tRNA synthetase alpha chain